MYKVGWLPMKFTHSFGVILIFRTSYLTTNMEIIDLILAPLLLENVSDRLIIHRKCLWVRSIFLTHDLIDILRLFKFQYLDLHLMKWSYPHQRILSKQETFTHLSHIISNKIFPPVTVPNHFKWANDLRET